MTDSEDLNSFIQQQKAKLSKERAQQHTHETENQNGRVSESANDDGIDILTSNRKQWDKDTSSTKPVIRSESPEETGLKLGNYQDKRRKLQTDRHQEYNQFIAQKNLPQPRNGLKSTPAKPSTPETGIAAKLGGYEDEKKKLDAQRKQEYLNFMANKNTGVERETARQLPPKPSTPEIGIVSKLGTYDERKKRLQDERKEEYNKMIAEQNYRRTGQSNRDPGGVAPNLPGYSTSNEEDRKRKEKEAYKEELRRQMEEQLRNKRSGAVAEPPGHSHSGRTEDVYATLPGLRDHASAEARKIQERNREYNEFLQAKKGQSRHNFDSREDNFSGPPEPRRGWATPTYDEILEKKRKEESNYRSHHDPDFKGLRSSRSEGNINGLGNDKRLRDLDREYEKKKVRFTEDQRSHSILDNPDWLDIGRSRAGLGGGGSDPYAIQDDLYNDWVTRMKLKYDADVVDRLTNIVADRTRQRPAPVPTYSRPAELPYPSDLDRRSQPNRPPPAVQIPALDLYSTPADDTYKYFANRNPLDAYSSGAGGGLDHAAPVLSDRSNARLDHGPAKPDSRRDPGPARTPFPVDNDRDRAKQDAQKSYQEELKRQMEEQKQKKQNEKKAKDAYERKLDEEIRNYDPFGRGGGGAPLKDNDGNVLANLRELHNENQDPNKRTSPRKIQVPPPSVNFSSRIEIDKSSPPKDTGTFERGGHGIFGDPITDAEKVKRNRYQDDLRLQMEEKKRELDAEKERQRSEDQKLLKKIEEDNLKMQQQLEEEKRKEREKHEAAQRQQEELRRQQEEKRKEEERKRMEADDRRQQELRRQEDERQRQKEQERQRDQAAKAAADNRLSSPPIPALRSKTEHPVKEDSPVPIQRSKTEPPLSPPVPARKTQSRQSRVASADVLNQLAHMRQQLQSERKRVESDLKKEQDKPDIFDPRLQQKPPPKTNFDIFEVARNKEPVAVRRPPTDMRLKPTSHPYIPNRLNLGLAREGSAISAALLDSESAFIDVPEDTNYRYDAKRNDSARNRHRTRSNTPKGNIDQFGSLTSLDPDRITRKNEERLRKLKAITSEDTTSLASADADDILDRFMARQQHTRPPSGQTLVDDSWLRPGTRVM